MPQMPTPDAPGNHRRQEHLRTRPGMRPLQPQGEMTMDEHRSWVIIDKNSTQVIDRCDTLDQAERKAMMYKLASGKELEIEKR